MSENENNRSTLYIVLIVVLILVFIGLLFLSSTDNTDIKYEFEDAIVVSGTSSFTSQIGNVNVKNYNILPAKVELKDLVVCVFDDNFDGNLDITYGAVRNYYDNKHFIELKSKEEKSVSIILENIKYYKETEPNDKGDFKLYLFENTRQEYYYDNSICYEFRKADAVKIIDVNVGK